MKNLITPWEVSGHVDYDKLVAQFGVEKISSVLAKKIKDAHPLIKRGLYFSHRDFGKWLAAAQSGKKISILTGRGPSEKLHLGHLIPLLAAHSLQKAYGCHVYIPLSVDEKFFVNKNLSISQAKEFSQDNLLDIIALGFLPGKTFIIQDFSYASLYEYAARCSKLISYSTAKAVFGLLPETNIGWTFYPAVQAAHILLPQFKEGPHLTLVPVGIDQDPFIRLTRDIAEHQSLGFIKPAAIHAKFIPSLKGSAKMSSSDSDAEQSIICLSDSPEAVKKKINKHAFSGGKDTIEEHKKHGGNPEIDISYQYLKLLFEPDDKKLEKIERDYKSGKLLSGELKSILIEKINTFLAEHRKAKEHAKQQIRDFVLK